VPRATGPGLLDDGREDTVGVLVTQQLQQFVCRDCLL
jgi:hypothetical protein